MKKCIYWTYHKKSDWSGALNQYTIKCEVIIIITRYLQQILQVSCRFQPLPSFQALTVCEVFLNFCKFREKCLPLQFV